MCAIGIGWHAICASHSAARRVIWRTNAGATHIFFSSIAMKRAASAGCFLMTCATAVLMRVLPISAPWATAFSMPICRWRSEEHTSELQSLMRISYAVFCLKKKKKDTTNDKHTVKVYDIDNTINILYTKIHDTI